MDQLRNYLSLNRSPKAAARAHFYLGEALAFMGSARDAFFEFLSARDSYPTRPSLGSNTSSPPSAASSGIEAVDGLVGPELSRQEAGGWEGRLVGRVGEELGLEAKTAVLLVYGSPLSRYRDEEVAGIELNSRERRRRGHSPACVGFPDLREFDEAGRLPVHDEAMIVAARRLDVPADALGLPEIEGVRPSTETGSPVGMRLGIDGQVRSSMPRASS